MWEIDGIARKTSKRTSRVIDRKLNKRIKKIMTKQTSANLGFEKKLWAAADKMRGHMDPAEYKHVVLGLIFLKYISDSFEETYQSIKNDTEAYDGEWEDKDAYKARNVFWVPEIARWDYLKQNAKKPEIGKIVDDAMIAIEKENPSLKGVLPKRYARPDLNKQRLGEIIDIFSSLGLGDKESKSKDLLGRVYEYFIGRFASAEGKGGGEFYTPASVVKLLVQMIEPYKGRVFDPCCGSGGMFVQSEKFVEEHGGRVGDIAVYGQESNPTTWKLAKMNLAIRGIEGNLGEGNADSFAKDQHPDLKADFVLANPPFNDSDWGGEKYKDDVRWKFGTPPTGNANYAWIQHFIHHLSPTGIAGFVLANGSLSTNKKSEKQIRQSLVDSDLIDCVISLPTQLFYNTQISASLWFVTRNKRTNERNRQGEVLFVDVRSWGVLEDRTHKVFKSEEISRIVNEYKKWKTQPQYINASGFTYSAKLSEIAEHQYALVPGRYVGFSDEEKIEVSQDELVTSMDIIERRLNEVTKLSLLVKENLLKVKNG